jgi:lipopolysaccharide transport system ATP-binding protein
MSDVAIQVEGLGKCYRLGEREPYRALRDVLAGLPRALVRRRSATEPGAEPFWALRDVSFEVRRGAVVGIIGHNGAGKSTLLKVLSRITRPTVGRARVHGRVGSLLEVGTGFHPELSGRENIFLNGAVLGMRRHEIQRRFDEIVAFAEVERFLDTPVKHYSSGMYTRLAFAVAAHLEPEILLVDEVLAVGDAAFQKKCLGKMGQVAREGRTVLFVSHAMAAIENLCDSAVLLDHGRVAEQGSTSQVIASYLHTTQRQNRAVLAERRDREGNGTLRLLEFSAYGTSEASAPVCGGPATLELTYEAKHALRHVHISVGFYTPFGEGCLYLSNDLSGDAFEQLPAAGSLRCRFDRLTLLPGTYSVNLYCTVNGVLADWVRNAADVTIEGGDYYGTGKLPPAGYGRVAADHRWTACAQ